MKILHWEDQFLATMSYAIETGQVSTIGTALTIFCAFWYIIVTIDAGLKCDNGCKRFAMKYEICIQNIALNSLSFTGRERKALAAVEHVPWQCGTCAGQCKLL
jgi:hypothetical protein